MDRSDKIIRLDYQCPVPKPRFPYHDLVTGLSHGAAYGIALLVAGAPVRHSSDLLLIAQSSGLAMIFPARAWAFAVGIGIWGILGGLAGMAPRSDLARWALGLSLILHYVAVILTLIVLHWLLFTSEKSDTADATTIAIGIAVYLFGQCVFWYRVTR